MYTPGTPRIVACRMSQTKRLSPFAADSVASVGGPPSHLLNVVSFTDVNVRIVRPDASAIDSVTVSVFFTSGS